MTKNKRLEIRINEQKKEMLQILADKQNISLSNLVDNLINQYLLDNLKDTLER